MSKQTNHAEHSGSTDCSVSPSPIDRETVLRHKRGFEALRRSLVDLKDAPEMNSPEQIDEYLRRVPDNLRKKMRTLMERLAIAVNSFE